MSAPYEPLPESLPSDLTRQSAYPADEGTENGIEHIQTHISHVYLTRERVYKVRKAAALGFVDFGRRAQRNADCLDELRLNRRLAPEVYIGVARIERAGGRFRVGRLEEEPSELDPAFEHCVVMHRLPAGRDALTLLETGELENEMLDLVATRLAAFHRAHRLPVPTPFDAAEWRRRVQGPVEANLLALETAGNEVVAAAEVAALRAASEGALSRLAASFERRRLAGRIVDGHGDLHLQHVWLPVEGGPWVIDCLEFSEKLRHIDAASEVAFLAMDLAYRGESALAERFVARYAAEIDDFDLYSVLDFFISYRAAVRGKVASIAAADREIAPEQRAGAAESTARHTALALAALAPRPVGGLLLVGGRVGTGKSSLARAVSRQTGAVVIASDRVRKARLGLAATDRLASKEGAGPYSPEQRSAVYEALLDRAAPVLDSGRDVILDATYARRSERDRARAFAEARGAACGFIEAACADDVARVRLAARSKRGDDASDAGPERVAASRREYEPLDEWPAAARCTVETDRDAWRSQLSSALGSLGFAPADAAASAAGKGAGTTRASRGGPGPTVTG